MITMSAPVPNATAMRNARPVVTKPPTYGMKQAKKDSTATGTAKGSPRITMMRSCDSAPTAEMTAVPPM